MYARFIILISAHRFEAIFNHRFGTFSKDAEKFWNFASENIPDFYMPSLKKEMLVPNDKLHERMCPQILLYAVDKPFHVFRGWGQMTSMGNAWLSMRSCHLPHSIAWSRGKPINPHKTHGSASTMVDVDDKKGLEWLT